MILTESSLGSTLLPVFTSTCNLETLPQFNSWVRCKALFIAITVAYSSTPLAYLALESEDLPTLLEVRRILSRANFADSKSTAFVVSRISEFSPPITPARPTAFTLSQISKLLDVLITVLNQADCSQLPPLESLFDIDKYTKMLKDVNLNSADYTEFNRIYENLNSITNALDAFTDDSFNAFRARIEEINKMMLDTSFWNDLDKEKIEAKIPEITDMWRSEIRKDYSKKEHMRHLVSQLKHRFAQLYDYTALFTYYDGGDATGVYAPHFDVKLTYPNGSIHIRTTAYANAKGYGYEVTHMLNGKKTTSEKRDLQVVDPDFIYLRTYQKETRAKYMEKFNEIIEEYSNFD